MEERNLLSPARCGAGKGAGVSALIESLGNFNVMVEINATAGKDAGKRRRRIVIPFPLSIEGLTRLVLCSPKRKSDEIRLSILTGCQATTIVKATVKELENIATMKGDAE